MKRSNTKVLLIILQEVILGCFGVLGGHAPDKVSISVLLLFISIVLLVSGRHIDNPLTIYIWSGIMTATSIYLIVRRWMELKKNSIEE